MSKKFAPPIHKIRVGRVCASIWKNTRAADPDSSDASAENADESLVRHSVTFEKVYVDEAGQFQTTYSYGPIDTLLLAECARQAAAWIYALPRTNESQQES